jgi:hypothetical protein
MQWRGCGNLLRKAVVECDLTSSRKRRAHLFVEKCAPRQVEQGITCQAELAEVCLGRGNGIISGVLWERKPKKIR